MINKIKADKLNKKANWTNKLCCLNKTDKSTLEVISKSLGVEFRKLFFLLMLSHE